MRSISLSSLALAGLLLVVVWSCTTSDSNGPTDPPAPTRGSLRVNAQTTGTDTDPDGYIVSLTGRTNQPVASDGSTLFEDLAPGGYIVSLSGVAPNCAVGGGAAHQVTVIAGPATRETFIVTCDALVGGLQVTTVTTGEDLDPDGYEVTVDGAVSQSIGTSGTISFADLSAGSHTVELSGLADNCSVSSLNPRNVSVAAGGSAQTTFTVECSSLLGSLTITTTTTGEDLDPDGYTVTVDGSASQSIGVNASATFEGLTAGEHSIGLSDLTPTCAVSGANPQTVDVPEGGTATVEFQVTCDPTTGSVEVVIETTGTDLDPDGYEVLVDGGNQRPASVNGTLTYAGLVPGEHSIQLAGVAANCNVSGANLQTVTVVGGESTTVRFDIACTSLFGTLRVGATTTGDQLDPDGYVVSIDGGSRTTRIEVNGETGFGNLAVGDHQVELLDVADNCQVFGDNPRTATVIGAQSVTTTFALECSATVGEIRVRSVTTGADLDPDGYVAQIDGGVRTTRIGVNDETGFGNLAVGDHQVEITDVASNCSVLGQNPRTVTVAPGQADLATFEVTCSALPAYAYVTGGTWGTEDRFLSVINAETHEIVLELDGAYGVTAHPDRRFVLWNDEVRSTADFSVVRQLPFTIALITLDGTEGYAGGTLTRVVELENYTVLRELDLGGDGIRGVTADGEWVLVSTGYMLETLRVLDSSTGAFIKDIPLGASIYDVEVHPSGRYAYVSHGAFSGTVTIVDLIDGTTAGGLHVGDDHDQMALSPDGRYLYVAAEFSGVVVFDLTTNSYAGSLRVRNGYNVAVTPDSRFVYVVDSQSTESVVVFEYPAGPEVTKLTLRGNAARGIAMTR